MLKYLQVVTRNPNNVVWVISGRDQGALDEWLGGIEGLGMSAEHGCFTKQPDSKKWINLTEEFDMSWKNDVIEIFTYYTERTQGSFIEHKRSSLTWHYRMADPDYGYDAIKINYRNVLCDFRKSLIFFFFFPCF